jgi:hypothetical protein
MGKLPEDTKEVINCFIQAAFLKRLELLPNDKIFASEYMKSHFEQTLIRINFDKNMPTTHIFRKFNMDDDDIEFVEEDRTTWNIISMEHIWIKVMRLLEMEHYDFFKRFVKEKTKHNISHLELLENTEECLQEFAEMYHFCCNASWYDWECDYIIKHLKFQLMHPSDEVLRQKDITEMKKHLLKVIYENTMKQEKYRNAIESGTEIPLHFV